ncbi:hypothetical protein KR084_004646, partial [Drosophila pseudotakahashii]
TKAVILGMELKYNITFVEYFGSVPGESQMLMINSTKLAKKLFMDNRIENEGTNRTVYNIKNFPVCNFLNNRLLSKIYSMLYEEFVGNSTVFKCPIQPGVYYLRNNLREIDVPLFHPPGKFRLTVRLKAEPEGSFALEITWRYRVIRT